MEDELKNKDNFKNEDNLEIKDNLEDEDDLLKRFLKIMSSSKYTNKLALACLSLAHLFPGFESIFQVLYT